jgi:hypothetical protein
VFRAPLRATSVVGAGSQARLERCRVHFMRTALAHAGRSCRRVIATAFA